MAFDLSSITTDTRLLPPRVVLLGTPKVGKTTFAASAPGVVFLPVRGEEGADDMVCAKFPTAQTYDDVIEMLTTLATQPHHYTFAALDSTSALERLVWEKTCQVEQWTNIEKPGYGKGFTIALSYWQKITDAFDHLRVTRGMGCFLIGHVKVKDFNDPMLEPYDKFIWDVKDNAASMMTKWADCVLFARPKHFTKQVGEGLGKETHAIGSGERCLYTQERPAHPGGGRGVYGRLPYELPLNFNAWMAAVGAEMAKVQTP